jgi:large subunit ribosomal protein L20
MQLKHKKIRKLAKGFFLANKNVYSPSVNRVNKAAENAYRSRRLKKRDFRSLWITQTGAALKMHNMQYSRFIHAAQVSDISLNRKVLAQLAITEPYSFQAVVETVKATGAKLLEAVPPRKPRRNSAERRYARIAESTVGQSALLDQEVKAAASANQR